MDIKRKSGYRYLFCTILLFAIIFSIRMVHIGHSTAEAGEYWRQPDTESIARIFLQQDSFTIFPQLNYDGPMPNYVQLEFQVTTLAIALLYKIFGYHVFLARLVPILFFMASAWYLFLLARKRLNYPAAWMGTLIYGIFPITVFYSRAVMPESALLFFYVAALYYFEKWLEEERFRDVILSGLLTMLAISQKPPIAFIGLAMLVLCFYKYGRRIYRQPALWLLAALSLLPPLVYFQMAGAIAETQFVTGIATRHIFPKALQSMLDPKTWKFFASAGSDSFSVFFLVFGLIGFVIAWKKRDHLVIWWAIAIFLEQAVVNSVIRFPYYMDVIAPVLALLVAYAANQLIGARESGEPACDPEKPAVAWKSAAALAVLLAAAAVLIYQTQPRFAEMPHLIEQARIIDEIAQPGELVLIGSFDPAALSLSSRQGWRVNIHYYSEIPEPMEDEMAWYIAHGAKYMVINGHEIYDDDEGIYFDYLDRHFASREIGGCTVFYLEQPRT